MEDSILTSTKKNLGISKNQTSFDLDVITHINSAFSTLNQIGIGAVDGIMIEDESADWASLNLPVNQVSMVKSYVYLKVRMLFDPPSTSFHLEAMNKQIEEFEVRLSIFRENALASEEV